MKPCEDVRAGTAAAILLLLEKLKEKSGGRKIFGDISCLLCELINKLLAWRIPWMEEPGGLQSMGSLRVGHD